MKKSNAVAEYSLQTALEAYDAITKHLNKTNGPEYAKKNPGIVTCLLRFQEEMIRSTCDLIGKDKLQPETLEDLIKS
jgi:hypothetical protein